MFHLFRDLSHNSLKKVLNVRNAIDFLDNKNFDYLRQSYLNNHKLQVI